MHKTAKYFAIALISGALMTGVASANNWGGPGDGPGAGCAQHRMMQKGGPGGMQRPGMHPRRDLNLSADQVRTLVEARLIMRGNDRLKVGNVTPDGENDYKVQIVTVDGSLVRQFDVDKHRGLRPMHHRH